MLEESSLDNLPEIYYKETPPQIDQNFIARKEEIRVNARKTLQALEENEGYLYLLSLARELDQEDCNKISLYVVIGYVQKLKRAIDDDDYITMRRYESPDGYLDSIMNCEEKARKIPPKDRQLTFDELTA